MKIYYQNKKGADIEITHENMQYIFLEPLASAVVRYTIKHEGKIYNEVKETDVLSVKFIKPSGPFLSKKTDFDAVEDRSKKSIELEAGVLDALYVNKLDEKVKVKVIAHDKADEILENEHSYIDAPDAFIRAVGVSIDSEGLSYTLLFRRAGRVHMSPSRVSYEQLARVVKSILFLEHAYYTKVPRPAYTFRPEKKPQSVIDALILDGWDISDSAITKNKIKITDAELGAIIKKHISREDIVQLFQPVDLANNGNYFIDEGAKFLAPCDSTCSLPKVTKELVADNRG